tara:strand:- start:585 stop:1670 length:1086 start_codon:yes stop_codon:yes gene_type:complete
LDTILPNIREYIKSCGPGGKIPTIRELSVNLGASQVTVRQAIQLLEQEGLVKAYVGRGTYVTSNEADKQQAITSRTITVLRSDWPSRRGEELTRSIYQAARSHGYRPAVVTYTDYEQIRDLLHPSAVSDAYILQPNSLCSVQLLAFLRNISPNVLVEGMELTKVDVDSLAPDWQQSIVMSLSRLTDQGHKSIMLISGEPRVTQLSQITFFKSAMQLMGLKHDESVIGFGDTQPGQCSTQGARTFIQNLLEQNDGKLPCSAMVVLSYASAVGIVEALQQAGLNHQDDVTMIVLDNPDMDTQLASQLNMIGVTAAMTGQAIIDRLEARWADPQLQYENLFTPPLFKPAGQRLTNSSGTDLSPK